MVFRILIQQKLYRLFIIQSPSGASGDASATAADSYSNFSVVLNSCQSTSKGGTEFDVHPIDIQDLVLTHLLVYFVSALEYFHTPKLDIILRGDFDVHIDIHSTKYNYLCNILLSYNLVIRPK
ncbi:hypothetical protein HHI36_016287 [Cryptolaemus montrouzieri]|uniref:Uncharacterized protein n=1 Tax=Cryptolaemus montrouzieri TaxID=559131 RepID=A0ABD2NJ18_9CUCU